MSFTETKIILKTSNKINLFYSFKISDVKFLSGSCSIIKNPENLEEFILNLRCINYEIINNNYISRLKK